MKLFLDANVLFASAISPDGRCAALMEVAVADDHQLLGSVHVITEARTNIVARYPVALRRLEDVLLPSIMVVPVGTAELVLWAAELGLPDNDAPVLAAAVASGADVLVTGDQAHFEVLLGSTTCGVRVVTPRSAPALLLAKP